MKIQKPTEQQFIDWFSRDDDRGYALFTVVFRDGRTSNPISFARGIYKDLNHYREIEAQAKARMGHSEVKFSEINLTLDELKNAQS